MRETAGGFNRIRRIISLVYGWRVARGTPIGVIGIFAGLVATSASAESGSILPELGPGFAQAFEAREYEAVCPRIRIRSELDLRLRDMETRLVCGDSKKDGIGIPWAEIPPNQAAYFMRGFLQSRGYHGPRFIQDGEILFVDVGPRSHLTGFTIMGGPTSWAPPKRRLIRGNPLASALLDDLERWTLSQIRNEGYACATAEGQADPLTGEARVRLSIGELKTISRIEDIGDTGLRSGVLDRYNAFRIGDVYRERLVTLTRKRTVDDGFLQSLTLSARCEPGEHVTLVRDVVLGPSRTLRIGVGASTDEGARLRTIVRRNRIGSSASSAQTTLNLGYLNEMINRQSFDARFRWYYAPGEKRSFLEPSILFDHDATDVFETQSAEARVMQGYGLEYPTGRVELRVGPAYLDSFRVRGAGPGEGRTTSVFAEFGVGWLDHDLEFFVTSPRSGESLTAVFLVAQKDWGSTFTAQRLELSGTRLWNIQRYDPPLLILGVRFDASSVFAGGGEVSSDLPVRFLTFLGGDEDLRGFSRQSLPRSGVGALSGLTASFEARLHRVILSRVDVFSFIDAGVLGGVNFAFVPPYFMSPGFGVRYESPIGVFRTYGARRFALNEPAGEAPYKREWRIGFTYGEEF